MRTRALLLVAADEWRCWRRSRLALAASLLTALLLLATTVLTALRMHAEHAARTHQQAQAEAAFLGQPDRHPHRMVHYGHYVFRTPAPLARFDPGLDAVTGQSVFLEGHRHNSAMFADSGASADLGAFSRLTPAGVYQVFVPLLLILLGHAAVVREREAGTWAALLAQGTGARTLVAGKALALLGAVALLMLPLVAVAGWAVAEGESPLAAFGLVGMHGLYLAVWALLALAASALLQRRAAVLASLAVLWTLLVLVLPSVAASVSAQAAPAAGKLETDLALLTELRKLGDGHNANDPTFAQLRADLLARHGVQRVEDLPVNLRGVVSAFAEERLTASLNAFARSRMQGERAQAAVLARHGWLSPPLALAAASRAIAGTDLAHHHRFLEEAEAMRFAFVQGLNQVHAEKLAYADDIRRSRDPEAERRTRVSATHWQLLGRFRFEPEAAANRLARAATPGVMLLAWLGVLTAGLAWRAGRLGP